MTAPNIVSVVTINGKTAVQAVGSSATPIVSNTVSSGKVLKINALYISNVDSTNPTAITVDIYRNNTSYRIATNLVVPVAATMDIISKSVYLEEGDSLRLTAAVSGRLEAVCSYEDIS